MAAGAFLMTISAALVSTFMLAQAVLAAAPTPVALRLSSDVAECPSSVQVQSALRQVLGDGDRSVGGWVLFYGRDPSAPEAERDASVLMELVDPAGVRLAERRIPASPGDCSAIASAMAAVVERSLRTLGWTKGETLPEAARRPSATKSSRPTARKRGPRLLLGLGPSFGTSPRTGLNLLLEARVRVAGPACLRLGGGLFSGSESQNVGSGKANLTTRYFTAAPLAAFALGTLELAAGPILLLSFDHGSTQGLAQGSSGDREVLAVGLGLSVAVRLSARWRVSLGLEGYRVALGADYFVELNGRRTVVLSPSPWEGIASAKLELVVWP
jgi:hypothetical protein